MTTWWPAAAAVLEGPGAGLTCRISLRSDSKKSSTVQYTTTQGVAEKEKQAASSTMTTVLVAFLVAVTF